MDLVMGAMGNLAPKLFQLLKEEYKLQKGLKNQVDSLSWELKNIYSVLRKVAEVPWDQLDEQVKLWACEVREKSYDMEDVLDTLLVRVEGCRHEPPDQDRLKHAVKKMVSLFSKGMARREVANTIEDIKKKLEEVAERRARYKVDDIMAKPAMTSQTIDPRLSALFTKVSLLVGIDEPKDALIKMLSIGDNNISNKSISVVGSGGLGKTTLAKVVYHRLRPEFDCGAFVPVGQNPDPRKVLRDILIGLDKSYTEFSLMILDERQLIQSLREYLDKQRYFIVIDDIWDTLTWEVIKNALVDSNPGSRIIVTTRDSQVATEIGEVYRIKELSEDNSKKLFYGRVFGDEDKCPDNDQLAEVSDTIIKKCDGVPLAITTLASLLATKPIEDWLNVYNSIGFGNEDNKQVKNMMKILSYSYYDLPCHLRTCLLYLSVYPEDCHIEKDSLIWKWIAEGLIHEEKGVGLFEVGDRYFYELINKSMILPVEIDSIGLVFGCRVHDIVLHLIRDLSNQVNFVSVLDNDQQLTLGHTNVRRLALQHISEDHNPRANMDMAKVRSFNAIGCAINMIPKLCSSQVLRVLGLEACNGMEGHHLENIGNLLHLRYLQLSHTPTNKLPEEIGHLKFLQTLDLEGSGIEELPASVGLLTELLCLCADEMTRVPDWIGKLTSLVQLEIYPGADGKSARRFAKELGNLRELRLLRTKIVIQDEGMERDMTESLSRLRKIRVIEIRLVKPLFQNCVMLQTTADFALSKHLRFLQLLCFQFSRLPAWINSSLLPNLCHLCVLVSHVEEQDLEILGRFQNLRCLKLLILNGELEETITCGAGAFQNLRHCIITKPLKFRQGAMPILETIFFRFCVRFIEDVSSDFGLGNLPSLQRAQVDIDCIGSSEPEVEAAEAALRQAASLHPNRPTLQVNRHNQDLMMDTHTRMVYIKFEENERFYRQIGDEQTRFHALLQENSEMLRSLPGDHPVFAETITLLKKVDEELLPNVLRSTAAEIQGDTDDGDLDQLTERNIALEGTLEILTVANQNAAELLDEMKAAWSLNREPHDDTDGEGGPTVLSNPTID